MTAGCPHSSRTPPPSRGSCRSVTTASKRSLAGPSLSIASSPFSTATTSWPSRSSSSRIAWRFTVSSSTTRMRSLGGEGVARALEQQPHRLAIHGVVVHDEDAELGERRRGRRGARQRREHALGERYH